MFRFLMGVAFGAAGYWAWQSFGRDLLGMGGDQETSYSTFSSPTSTPSMTSDFGSTSTSSSASGISGSSSPTMGSSISGSTSPTSGSGTPTT